MTEEIQRVIDQIERSYRGSAWHGPSVVESLNGVSAEMAGRTILPGAHTIWELVEHLRFWLDGVRRRIGGDPYVLPDGADWPPPPAKSSATWTESLAALEVAHRDLIAAVNTLRSDHLDRNVPEKPYTTYILLHGIAHHNTYHAGQIAMLKRAASAAR